MISTLFFGTIPGSQWISESMNFPKRTGGICFLVPQEIYVFINNPLHCSFRSRRESGTSDFSHPGSIFFRLARAGPEVAAQVEVPCRNGLFSHWEVGMQEKLLVSCCLMLLSWHELIRISPDTPLNNLPKRGII